METVYKTDCGKIRTHNEDNVDVFFKGEKSVLAVVADGMGGHRAGDVASDLTLAFIKKQWELLDTELSIDNSNAWLDQTIKAANDYVFNYAESHEECRGMGTTVVTAYCAETYVSIASVGDSRCYLFNGSELKQITEDHSLVNELVRSGQLSRQDAEFHPKKNVLLRALGTDTQIEVDTITVQWESGNMLLLCSDGLTNKVNDQNLKEVLRSNASLDEKAEQLVEMANRAGGEDNITVTLVMNINGDGDPE